MTFCISVEELNSRTTMRKGMQGLTLLQTMPMIWCMGRIVIVGYKPKPGKADALRALMKSHVQRLRAESLATARDSIVMEAADGTILEVFEWVSNEAIESAHGNPVVQAMWQEYAEVCDYIPVASVPEV